jgi:GR25 family glycosyltransferase involved in LPS biosynthesis
MLNLFKDIYCINLISREDRWHQVQKSFSRIGIKDLVNRFPAVNPRKYDFDPKFDTKVGPYHVVPNAGCLGSHRAIIKKAKEDGLKQVLVFEDDVSFLHDDTALVNHAIEDLPESWGLFYLGATIEEKMWMVSNFLFKTDCAKATHAVAYHHTVYDDILSKVPEDISDLVEFTAGCVAVDNFLIQEIQSKHTTYICNPLFAVQGRSFSDIVQRNIDYSHDQIRLFDQNKPDEWFMENHR